MPNSVLETIIKHKRIIPMILALVAIGLYMIPLGTSKPVSANSGGYGNLFGGNGGIGGAGGAGGLGGNGGVNTVQQAGGHNHQSANGGPANGGNGGSGNGGNACINAGCNSGSFRHP